MFSNRSKVGNKSEEQSCDEVSAQLTTNKVFGLFAGIAAGLLLFKRFSGTSYIVTRKMADKEIAIKITTMSQKKINKRALECLGDDINNPKP